MDVFSDIIYKCINSILLVSYLEFFSENFFSPFKYSILYKSLINNKTFLRIDLTFNKSHNGIRSNHYRKRFIT